ncbi:hypothetical protein EVAR_98_1 [Eumeta japonica]|uniref:Uncharacterized protein n=1 Tax=Eumeta variegata TaxID=151549 RepID=A0A4C1SBC4_EUMVA|nr:hypothetical protein EVAR_98_1 [Eumeta japonica]
MLDSCALFLVCLVRLNRHTGNMVRRDQVSVQSFDVFGLRMGSLERRELLLRTSTNATSNRDLLIDPIRMESGGTTSRPLPPRPPGLPSELTPDSRPSDNPDYRFDLGTTRSHGVTCA